MEIITVDDIRTHSRIDADLSSAGELTAIGEVAEEMVKNYMRRDFEDLHLAKGYIPAPVRHACLCVADDLYNHRGTLEAYSVRSNGMIAALLKEYVKLC